MLHKLFVLTQFQEFPVSNIGSVYAYHDKNH